MHPRRRLIAAAGVAAVLLGACSGSRSADDTMPPLDTSVGATGAATTSTSGSASTSAPEDTTGAPTTGAPAPSTAAATDPPTTTSSAPEPTEPASTTSAPPGDGGAGLVLRPDGIGPYAFGSDADSIIAEVTQNLGEPDGDTGWLDPLEMASCTDGEYRSVSWGSLSLLFTDSSNFDQGPRHLFGYEYGIIGQPGAEPQGLVTGDDLGVGTTVADLRQIHPDAVVEEAIEGSQSAYFYVTDGLQGLLSGVGDDDIVTFIAGGTACGL